MYFFFRTFHFDSTCACYILKLKASFFLQELKELEPDDALALDEDNIRHWLRGHDRLTLPEGGLGRFRPIPGERCCVFPRILKAVALKLKAHTQSKLRCICKRGLTVPQCLQNVFDILEAEDMLVCLCNFDT